MSAIAGPDPAPTSPEPARRSRGIDRVTVVSFAILGIILVAAVAGELLTRYGPLTSVPAGRLQPPSAENFLGTDNFGRDVLDRIVSGARSSILIGLAVGTITTVLGGFVGILVAVWRRVDDLVMRTLDAVMAFPPIFLAIALVSVAGAGTWQVIIALSFVYFPRTARVTRGIALSVVGRTFVEASTVLGARRSWIILRHIVPMVYGALLVQGTYVLARAIVVDASLSFLGLGTPPPDPTWGNMLGEARIYVSEAWWMATFPGIAIVLTTISINMIGDHLRDRLDRR